MIKRLLVVSLCLAGLVVQAAPRVPSFALRLRAGETVVAIGKEAPPE